ncbi:MAG: S8 family serine peptidase [Chloroflexia bacterium]
MNRFKPTLWIFLLVLSLAAIPAVSAQSAPGSEKIEPALLEQFAEGRADFIVVMAAQADLSAAYTIRDWNARGRYVYEMLWKTARTSQARAQEYLKERGLAFQTFIAGNEIYVWFGDLQTAQALAGLPEVAYIRAPRTYSIDPVVSSPEPAAAPQALDWGIVDTGADQFWANFGAQGDGIVVANIDTGVQWNHPALDQAYLCPDNPTSPRCWRDPSNICGNTVCDNNGHGTHTMGTMVGDDDPALPYQVGMAPNAKFIMCKGCESTSCSEFALNTCADWILAPDNDPANRPHVVNNSWGGRYGTCDTWYLARVQAWRAAGIFPAFSAGNGYYCNYLGVPAVYQESFASAAHDSSRTIADFSSRGPAPDSPPACHPYLPYTKPNLSAPGVDICSSVPTNAWDCTYDGTSMASPHSAGAVALLWSCNPSLIGQIDQTFEILQDNADPPPAGNCGAPPNGEGNYTYGYGFLNIYNAGLQWCMAAFGNLDGHVYDALTSAPIAGATVTAYRQGGGQWSDETDASGYYTMTVGTGTYTVTARHPLYTTASAFGVVVITDTTTTQNFTLQPRGRLYGYVTDADSGIPLEATLTIAGVGSVTTDPDTGFYEIYLDAGTYLVTAEAEDYYSQTVTVDIFAGQDTRQDFALLAFVAVVPDPIHAWVQLGQVGSVGAVMTNNMAIAYPFRFIEMPQAGGLAIQQADILLMGDDLTTAHWDTYRTALAAAGVTWDEWNLDTQPFPTEAQLAPYTLLIWMDNDTLTPDNPECQIVANWLTSGDKALFAGGRDFLWDLQNGTPGQGERNLYELFQTTYLGDYAGSTIATLEGVPGDIIGDPFAPPNGIALSQDLNSNGDYASETSVAQTGLLYGPGGAGSGHAALTHYEGANYRTVWLGLNFHNGMTSQEQRNTLMAAVLGFLIGGDVPWYGTSIVSGTVPAGDSLGWTNVFTASPALGISQPGDYHATLRIQPEGAPSLPSRRIPVILTALPTPTMGRLVGTVTSDRPGGPLAADILIQGAGGLTWTLSTDPATGFYSYWLEEGTYTVTASAAGYVSETAVVGIVGQMTTTQDFELALLAPEIVVAPPALEKTLVFGDVGSETLNIANDGLLPLDFLFLENATGGSGTNSSGGPDPFGYTFLDSNEPGGPRYEWIDATDGTPLNLGDDDETNVVLPFPFRFYDLTSTNLRVGNNGGLLFGLTSGDLAVTNENLGTTTAINLIVPFWDDIDSDTGNVYVKTVGTAPFRKFVVEWYNRPHYSNIGNATFELILYETTNNIKFQYQDVVFGNASYDYGASATVGIRRQGSNYLQYSYNQPVLTDLLAICFRFPGSPPCDTVDAPWLAEEPLGGTVLPGEGQDVVVAFDAGATAGPGTYTADLWVLHNDPLQGTLRVPVTLTVLPGGEMGKVAGTVSGSGRCDAEFYPLPATVHIEGSGGVSWTVPTDPSGYYERWLFAGTYTVTASAPEHIAATAVVTVTSGQTTTLDFLLRALLPCLDLSPTAFSLTLPADTRFTETLLLTNTGAASLTWEVHETTATLPLKAEVVIPAGTAHPDPAAKGSDQARLNPQPLRFSPPRQAVPQATYEVLLVSPDSSQGDISSLLAALALWPDLNVAVWDNAQGTPTAADLAPYDVVIFGNDYTWESAGLDKTAFGNALADYIDAGGKVIESMYAQSCFDQWGFAGRYMTDGYSPFTCATGDNWNPDTMSVLQPTHPVMQGVTSIGDNWGHQNPGLRAGAELLARWSTSNYNAVAVNENVVALNQLIFHQANWTGDVPILLHNAIVWLSPSPWVDVPWVSEVPTAGVVLPDSAFSVDVVLDTNGLNGGACYTASLALEHNDAGQPSPWMIPLMLCVSPLPQASFESNSPVCLGETAVFTNTSRNATSYLWSFGDGITSTLENPTHLYTEAGTYTVLLTATNDAGSDTYSAPFVVYPLPLASFDYSPVSGTAPLTVYFTSTSQYAGNPVWAFGDGTYGAGDAVSHTYSLSGTYTVVLTVTSPYGCGMATATHSVVVLPAERRYFIYLPLVLRGYSGTP